MKSERHSKAGKRGAQVMRERLGEDVFRRLGLRGGAATKAKADPGYYQRIGRAGAAKRWEREKGHGLSDVAAEGSPDRR